ncbi:ThiF/MoeB/HesA family protein [Cupriavidus necator N-1]|uniref:ThiF/MoeB/HesA family protein n=1 Tax=Cupriavidus necator (strain ATCC 43291 / DSM 13513 / CCUG 52238 / LMG 8453 / N-1) TaxID=1042878 RepID=G0EX16_CUPNN|nr:ThiF family adenylyltransferase [Cupriavidus necator]AEI77189.1 ThiF/MoeB/HesA family protein [Cupriavidus necator N-1]MDX6014256.1 ThiF family adenylyltransferase [Cupriavidus necator]
MIPPFSYEEFTTRNIGFITDAEQQQLRSARVLICGVGGMGGACLQALARVGIGGFALADFDAFDVSNLNRQVFASLDTVGVNKVEATVAQIRRINPELAIETFGAEWTDKLDELLSRYKIVVNGMDDMAAGIALYRKAREHGATVIDAYTAPLPSVTVVRPQDPRPEERLAYPTAGMDWKSLTAEVRQECLGKELEYVMVNSSSVRHVELGIAKDLLTGKRKRMSFAPMVITTGNLMAFEAIKLVLGRPQLAGVRGYFFNPWSMRVETPRNVLTAWAVRALVRRFMARLMRDEG